MIQNKKILNGFKNRIIIKLAGKSNDDVFLLERDIYLMSVSELIFFQDFGGLNLYLEICFIFVFLN